MKWTYPLLLLTIIGSRCLAQSDSVAQGNLDVKVDSTIAYDEEGTIVSFVTITNRADGILKFEFKPRLIDSLNHVLYMGESILIKKKADTIKSKDNWCTFVAPGAILWPDSFARFRSIFRTPYTTTINNKEVRVYPDTRKLKWVYLYYGFGFTIAPLTHSKNKNSGLYRSSW